MAFYPRDIEFTWLLLLIPIAGWAWISRKSPRRRSKLGAAFTNFASRRHWAVASVGLLALALRAALLPLHPVPQPGIVDEFSYQLAADTFASGRIANPPHALWTWFESPMILSQPTYVSSIPPAQGLVLAVGILLARNSWVGVWLSVGAMCSAIVWMLQGWIPPRWALLGGLLAIMRIAAGSYWIDSYWVGRPPLSAGPCSTVLCAPARCTSRAYWRRPDVRCRSRCSRNSRPYEGFLRCACGATLAAWTLPPGVGRTAAHPACLPAAPAHRRSDAGLTQNHRQSAADALPASRSPILEYPDVLVPGNSGPERVHSHAAIEDFHQWERGRIPREGPQKGLLWPAPAKAE